MLSNPTSFKDPRVVMRILIGLLLAGNLGVAVFALHPFGGSAEDLRREQQRLNTVLAKMRAHLEQTKKQSLKIQKARAEGDKFLARYFMDAGAASADIDGELQKMGTEAGIKRGPANFDRQPIEGSDDLVRLKTQVGFEGNYANFTKFINLVDKSPQFLIIESMTASAPQGQGGQQLNVSLTILSFIRGASGAAI